MTPNTRATVDVADAVRVVPEITVTHDWPDVGPDILEADGVPRFGAYRGIPYRFDYGGLDAPFALSRLEGFLRHKQWDYFFVATDEVIVTAAIADAGPTGTAFVMVTDRATGEVLADVSRPGGAGPLVSINEAPTAGHRAHYVLPGTLMTVRGDEVELRLRATLHKIPFVPLLSEPWLDLDVRFAFDIHDGLTTVAEIEDEQLVTATAKNAGLPTRGQLTSKNGNHHQEFDLTGLGGFDYTNGFLPRRTAWRWAFGVGTIDNERTVALNLVSGFTGLGGRARENCLWLDGALLPLDPGCTIDYDADDPEAPWTVRSHDGGVDLTFTPLAVHREGLNLGAIRSDFTQPTGHFDGRISVEGHEVVIDRLPGVVEDQDVLW